MIRALLKGWRHSSITPLNHCERVRTSASIPTSKPPKRQATNLDFNAPREHRLPEDGGPRAPIQPGSGFSSNKAPSASATARQFLRRFQPTIPCVPGIFFEHKFRTSALSPSSIQDYTETHPCGSLLGTRDTQCGLCKERESGSPLVLD